MGGSRWRLVLAGALATLTLGTAACGGADRVGAAGSAPGTATVAAGQVPDLLSFDGRTLDGKPFAGASLAGKPVVLWFWAPWCATCAGQSPTVQEIADQYGSRVGVLGVAGLGELPDMKKFVTETEVPRVTHLNDQAGAVWRRFKITQQSVFVMLDRNGTIVHNGWLDTDQFTERVKTLAG